MAQSSDDVIDKEINNYCCPANGKKPRIENPKRTCYSIINAGHIPDNITFCHNVVDCQCAHCFKIQHVTIQRTTIKYNCAFASKVLYTNLL